MWGWERGCSRIVVVGRGSDVVFFRIVGFCLCFKFGGRNSFFSWFAGEVLVIVYGFLVSS